MFEKLGLVQGLLSHLALQKGNKGPEKGLMASASSGARNKRPSWADMVTGEKPKENKEAKDEPMEAEEEWWHKDWKERGQSWDDWWKEKRQEWDDWKKSEKEDMAREEREYQQRMETLADLTESEVKQELGPGAKAKDNGKKVEASPEAPREEEEEDALKRNPQAKWVNRNGSQKERMRRKWATAEAEKAGQDPEVLKLGAIGQSRMKRLLSRQEDRKTVLEIAEKAEQATQNAAHAAHMAQMALQAGSYYMWPQGLV